MNTEHGTRNDTPAPRSWRSVLLLALALSCHKREATTKDDLGRPLTLPARITRIVTLAPNVTEIVFAVGAGDRVVGVDDASDYPAAAKRVAKVGGMQPNIEKIVALKPDLVLASTEGNPPSLGPALAAVNIPLFVVRTDRVDEVPQAMERVGEMLDAPNAKDAANVVRAALAAQKRTRARAPRVMFTVWTDPLYVAGRDTFTDDILRLTGTQNAVYANGWPQYSLESFVADPPDILLYPRSSVTPKQIEVLLERAPGVHPRIVPVPDDIFQRPGPRVGEAAAALNAILDSDDPRRPVP